MNLYFEIENSLKNKKAWFYSGLFLLVIFSLLIYAQTIGYGLIAYDDSIYLRKNSHLLDGFTISNFIWSVSYFVNSNWAPVVTWSYILDAVIYGEWYGGYHLTNVVLHSVNGLLVYFIAIKISKKYFLSLLLAIIFIIHPQHVESVAWLSQRKDLLSALFMFLSVLGYLKFKETNTRHYFLLSVVAFIFGLMAKVIIAPLPFVLILIDYIFLTKSNREDKVSYVVGLLKDKTVYILVAIVFGGINYYVQHSTGAIYSSSNIDPFIKLVNIPIAYMFYPLKTVLPLDLVPFYPYPKEPQLHLSLFLSFVLLSITAYAFIKREKYKYIFFGWFSYLLFSTPMSGLFSTGGHAYADRYSYIANIGLLVIVVVVFYKIIEVFRPKLAIALIATFLVVFSVISFRQTVLWRDTLTLFTYTNKVSQGNYMAKIIIARELAKQGKISEIDKVIEDALKDSPQEVRVHLLASRHLKAQGNVRKAIEYLKKNIGTGLRGEGLLLRELASLYYEEKDYQQAIKYATEAINTRYEILAALYTRGITFKKLGNYEAAIRDFTRAININGQYFYAYVEVGNLYSKIGRNDLALLYYRQALKIRPTSEPLKAAVNRLSQN